MGFLKGISKALGAAVGAAIFVAIKQKYPQAGPIVDAAGGIIFPAAGAWAAPKNK